MSVIRRLLGNVRWTTYTGQLHVGIDCVSHPKVISLVDDVNFSVHESCRLPATAEGVVQLLLPARHAIADIVVLARSEGYELIDKLIASGFKTRLITPPELKRFSSIKNSDDWHDAFWLAHLLRANALADGSVYQTKSVREPHQYPRQGRARFLRLSDRLRLKRRKVVQLDGGKGLENK